MINWREGKAGFVGGLKRNILGFFRYAYTVTTESAKPDVSATFTGVVKSNTFSGQVKEAIYSGSVKSNLFSGKTKEASYSGIVKQNEFSGNVKEAIYSGIIKSNTFSGSI